MTPREENAVRECARQLIRLVNRVQPGQPPLRADAEAARKCVRWHRPELVALGLIDGEVRSE